MHVVATDVQPSPTEYEPEFVQNILSRVDFTALRGVVDELNVSSRLPGPIPENADHGVLPEDQMRTVHFALSCIEVVSGTLTCPQCAQVYPIKDRIPNMVVA